MFIVLSQTEEEIRPVQIVEVKQIPAEPPKKTPNESPKVTQRIPALKKKEIPGSFLEDFPTEEVRFFDTPIRFVEGVRGTYKEVPGATLLKKIGRFYFYSGEVEKSSDVVYDPEKKSYGLFTGEVIVRGNFQAVEDFLQKRGLEILYQNEAMQNIIFKVSSYEELKDLGDLKDIAKGSIQADIKFSRLSSR